MGNSCRGQKSPDYQLVDDQPPAYLDSMDKKKKRKKKKKHRKKKKSDKKKPSKKKKRKKHHHKKKSIKKMDDVLEIPFDYNGDFPPVARLSYEPNFKSSDRIFKGTVGPIVSPHVRSTSHFWDTLADQGVPADAKLYISKFATISSTVTMSPYECNFGDPLTPYLLHSGNGAKYGIGYQVIQD